jgi:polyhydroxybutyrate depolymerase
MNKLLALGAWWFLGCAASAAAEDTSRRTIDVSGVARTYLIHTPADAVQAPRALVIALHGGGGRGSGMVALTRHRFDALADRDGAIVVYPDGIDQGWNDGRADEHAPKRRAEIDDVAFLRALVDDIDRAHGVDRTRVYATGISNGAMMCFRLAREAGDAFAAIAPVCGLVPVGHDLLPWPRPVSVLLMVGTEDPLVPFAGGDIAIGRTMRGAVLSAAATLDVLLAADHLTGPASDTALPDVDPGDGTACRVARYRSGDHDQAVEVYTVTGGGHTWPGGLPYLPERIIGRTSHDFVACDAIWEFFRAHHR